MLGGGGAINVPETQVFPDGEQLITYTSLEGQHDVSWINYSCRFFFRKFFRFEVPQKAGFLFINRIYRGWQQFNPQPSSNVTRQRRAVPIDTYTVTVTRAVKDLNTFIYISGLSISSKNSGLDQADVDGSCFTVKIVVKCNAEN
jgi:hypothetical protein